MAQQLAPKVKPKIDAFILWASHDNLDMLTINDIDMSGMAGIGYTYTNQIKMKGIL